MVSYIGLFILCPLFGPCYNVKPKPFPSMQSCLIEASQTNLGVCRKFKSKRFVGYISTSNTQGSMQYGDTK